MKPNNSYFVCKYRLSFFLYFHPYCARCGLQHNLLSKFSVCYPQYTREQSTSRHLYESQRFEKDFCGAEASSQHPKYTAQVPHLIFISSTTCTPHIGDCPTATHLFSKIPMQPKILRVQWTSKEDTEFKKQKERREKKKEAENNNLDPAAPLLAPSTGQPATSAAFDQRPSLHQQPHIIRNQRIVIPKQKNRVERIFRLWWTSIWEGLLHPIALVKLPFLLSLKVLHLLAAFRLHFCHQLTLSALHALSRKRCQFSKDLISVILLRHYVTNWSDRRKKAFCIEATSDSISTFNTGSRCDSTSASKDLHSYSINSKESFYARDTATVISSSSLVSLSLSTEPTPSAVASTDA